MILSQQRCLQHPAREAVALCPGCRQTFCRECVTEHEDRVLCAGCLSKQAAGAPRAKVGSLFLVRLVQMVSGLVMGWLFFYWIGQGLLAIPSSFHDGTVWKSDLTDLP